MSSLEGYTEVEATIACAKQCARFVRQGDSAKHTEYLAKTLESAARLLAELDEKAWKYDELCK